MSSMHWSPPRPRPRPTHGLPFIFLPFISIPRPPPPRPGPPPLPLPLWLTEKEKWSNNNLTDSLNHIYYEYFHNSVQYTKLNWSRLNLENSHTLLLFHGPHVSSLHMLFSTASPSLALERRILGRPVLRHVIIVILLLLIVVVFIVTVVAVFVIIAALVGWRLSVASLCVPPMLVGKKTTTNSHKIILRWLFSSSILVVMNSPERTGHPPRGWIPGSCGFWAYPVDRSQSHSCQSWSCWRGSGAEKGGGQWKNKK